MKLKDILPYLDKIASVKLWQTDVYKDKNKDELVFEGCVFDIPWVYLDYYLDNSGDGEAIDSRLIDSNAYFVISICENPRCKYEDVKRNAGCFDF